MTTAIPRLLCRPRALASVVLFSLLSVCPVPAGVLISNINTDKAAYPPGTTVTLYVDLQNTTGSNFTGTTEMAVSYLGAVVTNFPAQSVSLAASATTTKVFGWLPPATDFRGYLVSVAVKNGAGTVVDSGSSAVDVSSDWSEFPRYGYVSQFGSAVDAYNTVWQLKNFHINALQFYDWQWKHHIPYNSGASWPDIANRTISRATVTNLINAAHSYGMLAMNYNLYGGAYSNYLSDGSGVTLSMGIFSGAPASQANQMSYALPGSWATTRLYTMNNRDSGWTNYIYGREQTVFSNFAFDGWHIDSLGQHTVFDYAGAQFNLDDYNATFINNAKTALNKRMVFNTVDAVGENQVAQSANVDVLYAELWAGNANYIDFKTRVDNVRRFGSKAVVFPAYLNYNKTSGTFNEPGVRLADAAIFACGASHLELGDGDKMLHKEYFPDASVVMTASLRSAMRTYYDFLVGYQNLLRGDTVSATHTATITGVSTSTNGSAGKVWVISKKTLGCNIIHLVNLLNNTSAQWRDVDGTYAVPPTQNNLAVKMYYGGTLGGGTLWWASPDINSGAAAQLSYTTGSDGGGNFINFTVPQLQYWDMIWLQISGTTSAASTIQAENYDTMAGIGTEATSDAGGGLNVGFVNNTTGDSYVGFNNVDFLLGAGTVSARVASALAGGSIEFRLDSPSGPLIATLAVGNTGGWQSWQTKTVSVSGASGVRRVFAVFKSVASNLNWFQFNNLVSNTPPTLAAISDRTVVAGTLLSITNSATDPEVPPQTLSFSLGSAPSGASIDTNTGVLTWRPTIAQSPSAPNIEVIVADNGTPSMSATQSCVVTVNQPAQPVFDGPVKTNGQFGFWINGDTGPDYVILTSSDLTTWDPVATNNAPLLPFFWTDSGLADAPSLFYRIVLGP